MTSIGEFITSLNLVRYVARFVEQGIDSLEHVCYERDISALLEDCGVNCIDAKIFQDGLKHALKRENLNEKSDSAASKSLTAAVKAAVTQSRARQNATESVSASYSKAQ